MTATELLNTYIAKHGGFLKNNPDPKDPSRQLLEGVREEDNTEFKDVPYEDCTTVEELHERINEAIRGEETETEGQDKPARGRGKKV